MSSPMISDLRVTLRTGPFGVASYGRATHAPVVSNLYSAMMRGSLLPTCRAALGSVDWE